MNDSLRKVKLTEHMDGSGGHIVNGYFHKWGDSYDYSEDRKIPATVGIIELEDGKVISVPPFRVKFWECKLNSVC